MLHRAAQSASRINAYVRIVDKCVCDYACHIRGNTETPTARHASGIKSDTAVFAWRLDTKMHFFGYANVLQIFIERKVEAYTTKYLNNAGEPSFIDDISQLELIN